MTDNHSLGLIFCRMTLICTAFIRLMCTVRPHTPWCTDKEIQWSCTSQIKTASSRGRFLSIHCPLDMKKTLISAFKWSIHCQERKSDPSISKPSKLSAPQLVTVPSATTFAPRLSKMWKVKMEIPSTNLLRITKVHRLTRGKQNHTNSRSLINNTPCTNSRVNTPHGDKEIFS